MQLCCSHVPKRAALSFLFLLPGCIAAIGNRGLGAGDLPATAVPLLREKVECAQRMVTLRQQDLDGLRDLHGSGRVGANELAAAESALLAAKMTLLDCRITLLAAEGDERH